MSACLWLCINVLDMGRNWIHLYTGERQGAHSLIDWKFRFNLSPFRRIPSFPTKSGILSLDHERIEGDVPLAGITVDRWSIFRALNHEQIKERSDNKSNMENTGAPNCKQISEDQIKIQAFVGKINWVVGATSRLDPLQCSRALLHDSA